MGDDLKRRLIERMRAIQYLMSADGDHPGGQDGNKRQVVFHDGTVMDWADYGQALSSAYTDKDEMRAKMLLAVVL